MRAYCFTTGQVRSKRGTRGARRYLADDWAAEAAPVNIFVIEHPAGLCLFDTGQEADAARPGYFPRWHPFFRLSRFELGREDEAAPQLERSGLAPSAVRWVVLSHLHTDHVGGLHAFPSAEVLVSETEWRRGTGLGGHLRAYLPGRWPVGIEPRLVTFEGPAVGPFAASEDLVGDGTLLLVPTPGHTPGHMGLLVLDGPFKALLGGDLAHSAEALAETSPSVSAYCQREGIVYLATHDPRAATLLRRATSPI